MNGCVPFEREWISVKDYVSKENDEIFYYVSKENDEIVLWEEKNFKERTFFKEKNMRFFDEEERP